MRSEWDKRRSRSKEARKPRLFPFEIEGRTVRGSFVQGEIPGVRTRSVFTVRYHPWSKLSGYGMRFEEFQSTRFNFDNYLSIPFLEPSNYNHG